MVTPGTAQLVGKPFLHRLNLFRNCMRPVYFVRNGSRQLLSHYLRQLLFAFVAISDQSSDLSVTSLRHYHRLDSIQTATDILISQQFREAMKCPTDQISHSSNDQFAMQRLSLTCDQNAHIWFVQPMLNNPNQLGQCPSKICLLSSESNNLVCPIFESGTFTYSPRMTHVDNQFANQQCPKLRD